MDVVKNSINVPIDLDGSDSYKAEAINTNAVEALKKSVIHPSHYNQGRIEPWDAIEDWGLDYHLGAAVKYIARHKHKGTPLKDLAKAITEIERYIQVYGEKL